MKYLIFVCALIVATAATIQRAEAARLSIEVDRSSFENNGGGEVRVVLDPEGETITALSGKLQLSGQLEFSRLRDGGSIISAWVEQPRIAGTAVAFGGIIPGGFRGSYTPFSEGVKAGLVMAADVVAIGRSGSILLTDMVAYGGSDGSVEIPLRSEASVFEGIAPSVAGTASPIDNDAPTDVSIEIVEFPDGAGWYAIFSAVDAGHGISHFEVQENSSPQTFASRWKRAESPYRLEDQGRGNYVFVRAVDRAGNASIAHALPVQARPFPWRIPALAIAVLGAVYIIYRRRKV